MSSSEEEASIEEEKWDDMAIVRAFEDAMQGKRREVKSTVSHTSKKQVPRSSRSKQSDRQRNHSEEDSAPATWSSPQAAVGSLHGQHPSVAQQQTPQDVSQAAYAQAYAHLQAQWQASNAPSGYPHQYQQQPAAAPVYNHNYPPQWSPQMPHAPPPAMPFPSMPGHNPAAFMAASSSQDDLANLLMSWYQSGYYTGRYQAMQEMRAKNQR